MSNASVLSWPRSTLSRSLVALALIAALPIVLLTQSLTSPRKPGASGSIEALASNLNQPSLAFVPNRGQAEKPVRFEARGLAGRLAFSRQGISFRLPESDHALRLRYLNAGPDTAVAAGARLPGNINYYRGNDPAGWITNLPTYSDIYYRGLYPGIDVACAGDEGQLKSTFFLAPGADPNRIRWAYSGAKAVSLSASGALEITLAGGVQIVEQAPVAWQEIEGRRVSVPVAYALSPDGHIGFELGSYDATAPLTIDPTIVYETTVSGFEFDHGRGIDVDGSGNAYVVARAYENNNDVLILKLDPNGVLLYTTYIQGNALDYGLAITLGPDGNPYIAGFTDSTDFPTLNARQDSKDGTRDAYYAKLSADDGTFIFSSYLGASRGDEARDIALNSAGEIFLTGDTDSTDWPTTANAVQDGLNLNQCFCEDAFVTKLSPDGLDILYSTYLGGSFEDYGRGIGLDADGNIYIAGVTESDDFPTQNPIQPSRAGTNQDRDGFVARISADGSTLDYSTYLGGADSEKIGRIAVDDAGYVFVGGATASEDFPTTAGAYQEEFVGEVLGCGSGGTFDPKHNCLDFFVSKLLPDGSALAYSTFIGGTDDDDARDITIDDAGNVYLGGYTDSTDFPPDGSDDFDIVAAKLSSDGSSLIYAVTIYSPVANGGHGIAVDGDRSAYVTGAQNSPSDVYVAKISDDGSPEPTNTPTPTPEPTNTPTPEATYTPTVEPTHTPTPEPTNTPTPAPTDTPTPEPTDTPTAATTHVGDLDGGSTQMTFYWSAQVLVTVHDTDHNPVADVTVNGTWSAGFRSSSTSCVTGADGQCRVEQGMIPNRQSSITFTVDSLEHESLDYKSSDNHDPDDDSDGTSIVMSQ